jgi:hypothetical protein
MVGVKEAQLYSRSARVASAAGLGSAPHAMSSMLTKCSLCSPRARHFAGVENTIWRMDRVP